MLVAQAALPSLVAHTQSAHARGSVVHMPMKPQSGTRRRATATACLQEVGGQRLLRRYCAQHGGAAPYLAVDWVQAGLRPPPRETSVLCNAMLAHLNAGEHVYGAEDGAANSATVASAVTGGGELHHGAHVCCCGYQGRVDGRHWLTECDRGPTREVLSRI